MPEVETDERAQRSGLFGDPVMACVSRYFLLAGLPTTALYLLLPAPVAKLVVWPVIGWSSVLAILFGVIVHRPHARSAWLLLAAGVGMLIIGDNLYSFRSFVEHADGLFPSYVDVVYLAMYPLLIAGLSALVHGRTFIRDRTSGLDTAIITVGLGLVSWVLLIGPSWRSEGLSLAGRVVSMAYPIGDVALLAVAIRLAVGTGTKPRAFWLLAGSLVPLLVADSLYGYLNLAGTWHEHHVVDIGWAAFYFGWGAAALDPSMRELAAPRRVADPGRRSRLVAIGSAALVPPVALIAQAARGSVSDAVPIAIAGALLISLVLVRVADLSRLSADAKSETRFRALIENASDAIVVVDADGRILYVTPSTERVLGLTTAELLGRDLGGLMVAPDEEWLRALLLGRTTTTPIEWRMTRGLDDRRILEVVAANMRSAPGVGGLVLTIRDITEREVLDQQLREQALHDHLTGLPNRALFEDRVGQAIERSARHEDSVAVLLLDIDDFRLFNDGLGQHAGDRLIIAIAERLSSGLRVDETLARLGGDEFAVLFDRTGGLEEAASAAARLQGALAAPFDVGQERLEVRASMGLAVSAPAGLSPDGIVHAADLAMYVAKANGKDRMELYRPAMEEDANRRLEVAAELRQAISDGALVLHYQPILDIPTGTIVGVEALVRWQHPRRGLLSPAEFIPIAESSGQVIPLGRWVLGEACRQVHEWQAQGSAPASFYVSVNLSARHIQEVDVVADVEQALSAAGLEANALVIEVTETALIKDLVPAAFVLASLKELGVRIAVDDFGTGYSSLAHLATLPLDIIKIDKSFIDPIPGSPHGELMVRTVVDLAHSLGQLAVAEGVEHEDQAEALTRLGCRLAQGFLFARPVPAHELEILLRAAPEPHLAPIAPRS